MRRLVVIISLVAAQGVFSSAVTLHTDTFDVDLQGWTGGALPSHQTVGGVDGGYMRLNSDNNMGAYVQRADWL
ncbi:MAG TPA: hypothetical protein PJ982_11460, partial [Lacipirellulaceae bacterium]|nr:hypothetical protein [Lacipirellulaceae bacterium]